MLLAGEGLLRRSSAKAKRAGGTPSMKPTDEAGGPSAA
jgi:hypothetical protein